MRSQRNRSPAGAVRAYSMLFRSIGRVAPILFLLSCSSVGLVQHENSPPEQSLVPPRYSIVYIIHGDGGYGYHDSSGRELQADEEALAGAQRVAELNTQAEVFIFHERRRRRFLRLFWPLRDGRFYYYRSGRLLATKSYRRGRGPSRFDPEVALYSRFRAEDKPGLVKMLLYFGHEIPEFGGIGYDASYKRTPFNVDSLARGLDRITRDSAKFDLMVLSTCFNGTPNTVSRLAPYARYVVASPENLHLSYFDEEPLRTLDQAPRDPDILALAKDFARYSFHRLTDELQTEVSISVYDVERVNDYVESVERDYHARLDSLAQKGTRFVEYFDCAGDSTYARPGMSDGVDVFYRAPRFGRSKYKTGHSGWGCPRAARSHSERQ